MTILTTLSAEQSQELKALKELEAQTTPGPWQWAGKAIKSLDNREYILWPSNSISTDTSTMTEQMGACGYSAEDCAQANMDYLIACANFVRSLVGREN